MVPYATITMAYARLVSGSADPARGRCYRPLVAGPAMLRREPGETVWTVDLACERTLLPRAPRDAGGVDRPARVRTREGVVCRLGAALVGPLDAPLVTDRRATGRLAGPRRRLRLDIYGWALMYQPPGMRGRAVVDADDRFADLPAVFELPLEVIDRAEFLESRGFRTRPLVIPTQPEDFARGPDGRIRNRYFPEAAFRPPCSLGGLL